MMSGNGGGKHEHLVISGGGVDGLILYGAIREFIQRGRLDVNRVRTVHAVSAGALIAVMLLLRYSVEDMDDYIVKRPWHRAFKSNEVNLRNLMMRKGVVDSSMIVELVRPLLEANDVDTNITLAEFESRTNVKLFMYTVDLNTFPLEAIEVSAASHPSLPLSTALRMTCCYPMIFTPVIHDGGCYVDGGLVTKCPMRYCVEYAEANGVDRERILAFNCISSSPKYKRVDAGTPMVDYMRHIVEHMNYSIVSRVDCVAVPNTVECFNADMNSMNAWFQCLNSASKRQEYVFAGARFSDMFFNRGGGGSGST
jgi:predicted acylesterase/phospholipase RssA